MLRIKPLLVLCAVLLTVTPAASADVNSDMNQFFNKLGFASNVTQAGVWQGQAAGYAYGGSLYVRGKSPPIIPCAAWQELRFILLMSLAIFCRKSFAVLISGTVVCRARSKK